MYYSDKEIFKTFRKFLMPWRNVKWCERLNWVDVDSLLAAKCGALALTANNSAIPHHNAGTGLFAAKIFGPVKTAGLYYRTHLNGHFVDKEETWKGYEE